MGLFYRCTVTHTPFDEVIDDISWNYMPEPGCPNAESESSNLVPLQSHPVFRKTLACLQPPLIVLFSERCLYVFNIRSRT